MPDVFGQGNGHALDRAWVVIMLHLYEESIREGTKQREMYYWYHVKQPWRFEKPQKPRNQRMYLYIRVLNVQCKVNLDQPPLPTASVYFTTKQACVCK